jgi:predicted MFS family arabinose efflux permease
MTWNRVLVAAMAAAVAVAFADSSIVVLALPELYLELDTSVVGISWVITAYNLVVFVATFALLPFVRRLRPGPLVLAGLAVFLAASIACGLSDGLTFLIAARAVQGLGGAMLLAGSLPLLAGLCGSAGRGIAVWAMAGTVGATFGPAAGGLLTELFDWRAIFFAQAPVAGLAIFGALRRVEPLPAPQTTERPKGLVAANVALVFVFGALVGALFLAVLLIVTVWDFGPLPGAAVVSVLPIAALAMRPLAARLPGILDLVGGSILLAGGLVGLAFLPASSAWYAGPALALCGAGLGLVLPPLTHASVSDATSLAWSGTLSIGTRHAGLVLALVLIAPLLGYELERGGEQATLGAAQVIIEAPLPIMTKIPIALDMRDAFESTPEGEIPDLEQPFVENGAADDPDVAAVQEDLLEAIRAPLTRAFRTSFFLSAAFALAVLVPVLIRRKAFA